MASASTFTPVASVDTKLSSESQVAASLVEFERAASLVLPTGQVHSPFKPPQPLQTPIAP